MGYQPIILQVVSVGTTYTPNLMTLEGVIWGGYLYLYQFNSDLYETLNLSFWGTNQ